MYDKFKNITLLYKDKPITKNIKYKGVNFLVLIDNNEYPEDLFGVNQHFTDTVPVDLVYSWLKTRIFPPNRIDRKRLLKDLGNNFDSYDPEEIIMFTKGRYICDDFSVRFDNNV